MALLKTSPHDFIQETFAPMIAVMTSAGAEAVCEKNNLTFVELLKPFSKSSVEGSIRDSSGTVTPVKNIRVSFCDIRSRPPPTPVARAYFKEAVDNNFHDRTVQVPIGSDCQIDIPATAPWFEAWRSTFFLVQHPSDHEFTKHYVGCTIVVSNLDQTPMEKVAEMTQDLNDQLAQGSNKVVKWFGTSSFVLITYLLLHDNSLGPYNASVPVWEAMKATYGSSKCFFLSLNSQAPVENSAQLPDPWVQFISTHAPYKDDMKEADREIESAQEAEEKPTSVSIVHPLSPLNDPPAFLSETGKTDYRHRIAQHHGAYLSAEDINRIKMFVNDFCSKALIPHFEQEILILSDQISNKKGVSRSLFSATKRWFATTKPGTGGGNHIAPTAIAYSSDSHELQLRRLGDLCFMVGHYTMAYNAYHSAKRDFGVDAAWVHYAGALEMAALSAFMSNNDSLTRKMSEYAEESITTYQNACRLNPFATRATLLSVECLKGRGLYAEAAKQLIRMSGEDSDLRSAVFLEQAAYCYLSSRPIMPRKYAFNMVLAGNRFSKASHRNHSMRCYYQAYQVFDKKNWSIAEDHILYTIGKHASQLQYTLNAYEALSLLIKKSSRQTPQQQQLHLKDYITSVEFMGVHKELALPIIDGPLTQIQLNATQEEPIVGRIPASGTAYNNKLLPDYSDNNQWLKLEEYLVNYAYGVANIMIFKPTVEVLTNKTDNSTSAAIVRGEPVGVRIFMRNPLHIPITLQNIRLLWNISMGEDIVMDGTDHEVGSTHSSVIKELVLPADSAKYMTLIITPPHVGTLNINGVNYTLRDSDSGVEVEGRQLLQVHSDKKGPNTKVDKRLSLNVIQEAPYLSVSFVGLQRELLVGQFYPISVHLKNIGSISIPRILLTSSSNFSVWIDGCSTDPSGSVYELISSRILKPQETLDLCLLVQPNFTSGSQNLELLFYYDSGKEDIKPRYRLVRHSWPVAVYNVLSLTCNAVKSNLSFADAHNKVNILIQLRADIPTPAASVQDIELESVSLVSSNWSLTQGTIVPQDLNLHSHHCLFMLLKASRNSYSSPQISTEKMNPTAGDPHTHFIPSILPDDTELVICVNWRSKITNKEGSYPARGQKCAYIKQITESLDVNHLGNPSTLTIFGDNAESLATQLMVNYRIHHAPIVRHSFTDKRLCIIPVALKLTNCSQNTLNVRVDTVLEPDKTSEQNASNGIQWIGKTTFFKDIPPNGFEVLDLHVAVSTSGAYDLSSGLNVSAKVNNNYVLQSCKLNSIVIVH